MPSSAPSLCNPHAGAAEAPATRDWHTPTHSRYFPPVWTLEIAVASTSQLGVTRQPVGTR
jgi:hypothetical protein